VDMALATSLSLVPSKILLFYDIVETAAVDECSVKFLEFLKNPDKCLGSYSVD